MKAVSLFSGGLDSQLAACVIKKQGVEVVAINFQSPFFGGSQAIADAAAALDINLVTLDISEEYMEVLKKPHYGYGKNMNPCIDCHGFMIKKAGDYMKTIDASFIITGEVLGQRPMSQNRSAMDAVAKISGYRGLLVRPLSAQLLPPTTPEIEGWIDREKLFDIKGRSRARQMELAEFYGLHDYPSPAGGCLLTVQNFSVRLRRLLEMNPEAGPREMEVLKYGRHFIREDRALLIIGRNDAENKALLNLAQDNTCLFKVTTHPGPTSLLVPCPEIREEDLAWAASLTARYSDAVHSPTASVRVWHPREEGKLLEVVPVLPEDCPTPL